MCTCVCSQARFVSLPREARWQPVKPTATAGVASVGDASDAPQPPSGIIVVKDTRPHEEVELVSCVVLLICFASVGDATKHTPFTHSHSLTHTSHTHSHSHTRKTHPTLSLTGGPRSSSSSSPSCNTRHSSHHNTRPRTTSTHNRTSCAYTCTSSC